MLERIWLKNQLILRSIVQDILVDASVVEDVLQEAFMKIHCASAKFCSEQEAYKYIRRVVLNTSIDYYRSFKRRNLYLADAVQVHCSHSTPEPPSPLTLLIQQEKESLQESLLREVRKTLEELSPQQREAIEITFHRNHEKIKDICKDKGIPYSTLRSRVSTAIDRIRNRLKEKGFYHTTEKVGDGDL